MLTQYIDTGEELKRFEILSQVLSGCLSLKQAQDILGLSYRQLIRIKKRFAHEGFKGLLRKKPEIPPALKINTATRQQIINLKESLYWDFNILDFKQTLEENEGILLSYETLRKILIQGGLHEPKKIKKVYRTRKPMPKAGMLVLMHSCRQQWIESVKELWWLIAMVDDADGFVYAEFHPSETIWAKMSVVRGYIEQRGIFMTLQTDNALRFRIKTHGALAYRPENENEDTQLLRALNELNIKITNATTPQAKRRIERKFRFFQHRLIKEMDRNGINNYEDANKFLKEQYLPWSNSRHTKDVESIYMPLPPAVELDLIFSIKYLRKVNKDNTVKHMGQIYQLHSPNGTKTLAGKWVWICHLRDGRREILLDGKKVRSTEINTHNTTIS